MALQDAGTNAFFINIRNNSFLDPDFTVFAAISDMTVVNQIMALDRVDRNDGTFPDEDGNANFSDVPVTTDGKQVFIRRAFVINDSLTIALAKSNVLSRIGLSAAGGGGGGGGSFSAPLTSAALPEPATGAMIIFGALCAGPQTLSPQIAAAYRQDQDQRGRITVPTADRRRCP